MKTVRLCAMAIGLVGASLAFVTPTTAVMGYLDGTFTKPMALPGGKVIQPTGKAYHLAMATLGHWNKQGAMDKEYLFWDNASLMTQIGAAN